MNEATKTRRSYLAAQRERVNTQARMAAAGAA